MPRPAKPPRLWLRREKRKAGKVVRHATWFILDRGRQFSTNCGKGENEEAERALERYISEKYRPARRERDLAAIKVADVISIYLDDIAPKRANPEKIAERFDRLLDFWGERTLDQVTGVSCRQYVTDRENSGGARRDLEDLRAAINYHAKQGLHRSLVHVVLPEKGLPRDRWLRRSEAARLLWTCWRARETQTMSRGPAKGRQMVTRKRPLRHLARFILIGLYTGTRAGAIASASFYAASGRSFIDLESGLFYRLARGRRATKKRQPPVPLPDGLLAHMRRWKRVEETLAARDGRAPAQHVVEFGGQPIASVKKGFAHAVALAGLDETAGRVTPHTLRHTAVTWAMQRGVSYHDASGYFGMSAKMIENVYGHHHPDHLRNVVNNVGRKPNVIMLPRPKRA
jgi:integrase